MTGTDESSTGVTPAGALVTPPVKPGREQRLGDIFVTLADSLVEDYDIVELLGQLVAACLELLDVSAAGLLLDDQQGHLVVVASSSEEARLIEIFQLQNNEGPCLDAVRTSSIVSSGDLAAQRTRWPLFSPAATSAGFLSVLAIPMRLREQTIGALNLFDGSPEPISDADQRLARALADVATIGILQQRSVHLGNLVGEQLQHALDSRVVIEQAKGVLAERFDLTMPVAFEALRAYARRNSIKLTEVARAVISGEISPAIMLGAPAAQSSPRAVLSPDPPAS